MKMNARVATVSGHGNTIKAIKAMAMMGVNHSSLFIFVLN